MSEDRIGSTNQESNSGRDRSREDPDALTVCLVGAALLMALGLGVQKGLVAPRYAAILQDFGVETHGFARMVVLSPRILAIPLTLVGLVASLAGLLSRKAGLVVLIGLVAANIVMFAVMAQIEARLVEELI